MYLDLHIYSGLGNIIIIVDSVRKDISIDSKTVLSLYENKGINFDQLIQVLPPLSPENDYELAAYPSAFPGQTISGGFQINF